MTRETYLQFRWKPYPVPPSAVLYSGRIKEVRKKGSYLVLKTEKDQQISEYSVIDLELADVLQAGDIIAVDEFEKVYLLAPGEPVSSPVQRETLALWSRFLAALRDYFIQKEFLEVFTPGLVVCPGTEPTLEVFSTQLKRGSETQTRFLPTSPELHLKKALSLGLEKIFEIKTCYRNDEFSKHHQPEFTMLEWYRAFSRLEAIETDIVEIFRFLSNRFTQQNLRYPQRFSVVTVAELFKKYTGFEIRPDTSLRDYQDMVQKLGIQARGLESIDDHFFAIFIEKIESQLPKDELFVVRDYPPFQAALARINDQGWADRMEVYFGGFELANGFNELNNPHEQEARFKEDLEKKSKAGRSPIPLDTDFLLYLKKGMPPAAGIALGVERLFMALFGLEDIQSIKLFPYK